MSIEYPDCDNDDCWYKGNEDRLNEYSNSYDCWMISDIEIKTFCHVCFHNIDVSKWYNCVECGISMSDEGFIIDDLHYCPTCVNIDLNDDFILIDGDPESEYLRNVSCDAIDGAFQKDDDPNNPWLISSNDLMILSQKKLLSENFVNMMKEHVKRIRNRIQQVEETREKRQRDNEEKLSSGFIKYVKDLKSEDATHLAKKVHVRTCDEVPDFESSKDFFSFILKINADK